MLINVFSLLGLISLLACAPEPVQKEFTIPKIHFGPRLPEVDLGLGDIGESGASDPELLKSLQWEGEAEASAVLRAAENFIRLGKIKNQPKLIELGERLSEDFYSKPGLSFRYTLDKSPYASAAIGESIQDASVSIDEAKKMLIEQEALLIQLVTEAGSSFDWPKPGSSADILFSSVLDYLNLLIKKMTSYGIDPRIKGSFEVAIRNEIHPMVQKAKAEVNSIFAEEKPSVLLSRIQEALKQYEIELDAETESYLNEARDLMSYAEGIEDAAQALRVLVRIWEFMDKEDRKEVFRSASKDLYEYLDGKSDFYLDCLKSTSCKLPSVVTAKSLFIYPGIKKYGIENIKNDIMKAGRESAIEEVQTQAAEFLITIPETVIETAKGEIAEVQSALETIGQDFPGLMSRVVGDFSDKHMGVSSAKVLMNGFEPSRVKVEISEGKEPKLSSLLHGPRMIKTGAEVIGASLSLAEYRLEDLPAIEGEFARKRYIRNVIEQINKLLAIGGFKTSDGSLFSSLARGMATSDYDKHLNLRDFLTSDVSFAVPDEIHMSPNFRTQLPENVSFGVRGQAELLRGLSGMIRYFRDWIPNEFDRSLGGISAGDFIPELPSGSIEDHLFPKDMFFALSVGGAASILQNIKKKLSNVFLIDIYGKSVWYSDFDMSGGSPATIAAMVDIVNGERGDLVRSRDVAMYLNALIDFLEATEGVEQTKAGPLLEKGADGKAAVQVLSEARSDLRLLIIGLANFLSHQMAGEDGGIYAEFVRSRVQVAKDRPRSLIDQVTVMTALVRAGNYLNLGIYRWAARDILSYMNANLWSAELKFYREDEGDEVSMPDLEALSATLIAGEHLKPHMSDTDRHQWHLLTQKWFTALRQF